MGEQGNYEWLNVDSYLLGSTKQRFYWSSVYNLVFNINLLQTASETQTICWMPFYNIGEVMIYKITLVLSICFFLSACENEEKIEKDSLMEGKYA